MTPRQQAIEFFNKAVQIHTANSQMSYALLRSAAEMDPTLPEPWLAIATANSDMKLIASSIACYERYFSLKNDNGQAWTSFGHILYHEGRIAEAEKATRRAIELDPELANAWTNLSLIESVKGRTNKSVEYAMRGFDLDANPTTEMALGFAHLHARDLRKGLKHFEAKLSYKHQNLQSFTWPRWQGEDLTGKTLFVMADQGMGDSLDFLRFIPLVAEKCERVVFQVQDGLMRLASAMLWEYPNVEIWPLNAQLPQADFWCQNTSLPVALDLTSEQIEHCPQLAAPEMMPMADPPVWKAHGDLLHIGICWKGNPGNDIDKYRSMELGEMLRLYQVPGIQLYGLQIGQYASEIHSRGSVALVKDMPLWIKDTMDCAEILRHLDLVISVESFLPHLCIAVGTECWIPYAHLGGDWRVGRKGERTVWHPHSRIFHQHDDCAWRPVIDDIANALRVRMRK